MAVITPRRSCRQGVSSRDCLLLALGGNRQEIAVADHCNDTRERARSGAIERRELCPITWGTYDAREDHSGKPHVVNVGCTTGQFGREVGSVDGLTDNPVVNRSVRHDVGGDLSAAYL